MRQHLAQCGTRVVIASLCMMLLGGQALGQEAAQSTDRPNHERFNLHLASGGAFALADDFELAGYGESGGQGTLGVDFVIIEPIAFSLMGGYNAFVTGDQGAVEDAFLGMGFRLRFADDKSGALMEEGGNADGNLWLDLHFGVHRYEYENHGGFNIGLGYEFSIAENFNLGPYGRIQLTPWGVGLNYLMFALGVQVSLGGEPPPQDDDNDGIWSDKDKCPGDAEDKDGFEDRNGCPDPDNDSDGILDADDKCPNEAEDKDRFEDDDGCPEQETKQSPPKK